MMAMLKQIWSNEMNDNICPETRLPHNPDWKSVTIEHDGEEVYIDVNCRDCGCSGCIGNSKTLKSDISW